MKKTAVTKKQGSVRSTDWLGALREYVGSARCSDEMRSAPVVAVLAGPAIVIEVIVRRASEESGIAMDWGYVGGRAVIHSKGDRAKSRDALRCALPVGDLSDVDSAPSDKLCSEAEKGGPDAR